MSPSGNAGAEASKKARIKGPDTKINFFDAFADQQHHMDGLYEIDKPEEDKILETKIDPLEWKQEMDRVYRELVNIEKDIEILRK